MLAQLETPLDGMIKAARLAREKGAVFILDPAPARALPAGIVTNVDWLTPNEGEAAMLLGLRELGDPLSAARRLKALGPRGVVLKLGEKGSVLLAGSEPVLVPAQKVRALDTTAAGDAFNGAFAVALAEGKPAAFGRQICGGCRRDFRDPPWRATRDGVPARNRSLSWPSQ